MMKNKGVAAFVTDGLARDKAGIIAAGLPVFCQGIQPNSPAMNGPGVVGAAITLGDVHVLPGDIVVGDADGVVVIPAAQAERVLQRLAAVRVGRGPHDQAGRAGRDDGCRRPALHRSGDDHRGLAATTCSARLVSTHSANGMSRFSAPPERMAAARRSKPSCRVTGSGP